VIASRLGRQEEISVDGLKYRDHCRRAQPEGLIAAISFEQTDTTRISKYLLNYCFMLPG